MKNEYEVIPNAQFQHLNVFLVHLFSRTPHLHRELEFGIVLEGRLQVKVGQRAWTLDRDELYLINSMDAHEFITDEHGALVLAVQVSSKLVKAFLPEADRIRFLTPPPLRETLNDACRGELSQTCRALALHYHKRDACYELRCFSLILSVLYILQKNLRSETISKQEYLPMKRRADRMVAVTDYIDQNFQRKLLLEEIAEMQGLTMPHLSHLFQQMLGISFQDYLRGKRFEYAFPLVSGTNRSILDISLESGFSDARYLIRAFQEELGCTPKEYRRQLQKQIRINRTSSESLQYFLPREEVVRLLTPDPQAEITDMK